MDPSGRQASTQRTFANNGPYSARIHFAADLGSTIITLAYEEKESPSRNITLAIAPDLGSNMFRFRVGEHDIIYHERELLKRKDFTGNFVLWPFPNRIRDKSYTYQGQSYLLEEIQRPQGNAVLIHGLVFDRVWQYETPELKEDAVSVTTHVAITPDSPFYTSYPFDSRLSLTYTLTKEGVKVEYSVHNTGARDLPFGFGLHPYFTLLSGEEETVVSLPADAVMESDDELLPTGRTLKLDGIMYAMYDLRRPLPVSILKLDHVYTRLHPNASAVIEYRKQRLRLVLSHSPDFTHYVIYTPSGQPYMCLENQTCATDAINLAQRGLQEIAHLMEVHPGETSTGFICYTVEHL